MRKTVKWLETGLMGMEERIYHRKKRQGWGVVFSGILYRKDLLQREEKAGTQLKMMDLGLGEMEESVTYAGGGSWGVCTLLTGEDQSSQEV